jgi:SAM-dependent methyltransferase
MAINSYAAEWQRQAVGRNNALAGVGHVMLELVGLAPGMRVLDLGTGTGEQAIDAAQLVGPTGHVLATDVDPAMLRGVDEAIRAAGVTNVETRQGDAQALDVAPGSFDAAIARQLLMLVPEPSRVVNVAHRALRPDGRFAASVFATAERNPFLATPLAIARRVGGLPEPDPRAPGMFALGGPGAAAELLRAAGFSDVSSRTLAMPIPLPSAEAALGMLRGGFPPLRDLVAEIDPARHEDLWAVLGEWLGSYAATGEAFRVPDGEIVVVAGTA